MTKRVLAALSGGVDSALAGARLVDEGHQVTGVHAALWAPDAPRDGTAGLSGEAADARKVADVIGIPFEVWDLRERFSTEVVEPFVAAYAAGRTPNPCLRCNERIKFGALLDLAMKRGFDAVGTGHYARLVDPPDAATGRRELHRAADITKDQSYVLAVLDAAQLARCVFPLGGDTKEAVRREAASRGLPTAAKRDSLDVCFIPDGGIRGFLADRLGAAPGPILDERGAVIGDHGGATGYTVGQRKGLRLRRPAADGRPRYVVRVDPETNTLHVGPAEALAMTALDGGHLRWCGVPLPGEPTELAVQLRAHGEELSGTVTRVGADALRVAFHAPVRGVARGQTAVLYDGSRVIGSAVIRSTRP